MKRMNALMRRPVNEAAPLFAPRRRDCAGPLAGVAAGGPAGAPPDSLQRLPDEAAVIRSPDRPSRVARLEELSNAVRKLPMDAFCKIDAWVHAVRRASDGLDVDPTMFDAAAAHGEYAQETCRRARDALSFCEAWVATAELRERSLTGLSREGTALSPEGAALDLFLAEAAARRWYAHRTVVFQERDGVAVMVGPIRDALLRLCREKSPYVADFLEERSEQVDQLVQTLASGAHKEFAVLQLDASKVLFAGGKTVVLTSAGLRVEPTTGLDPREPVTPRARVDVPFEDPASSADADACVLALFPAPHPALLRILGAMLLPTALRHADQWPLVLVACGASGRRHPLVQLSHALVGFAESASLKKQQITTEPTLRDPYLLFVQASDVGTLSDAQLADVRIAFMRRMPVLIQTPLVPQQIANDPTLRLAAVMVPCEAAPPEAAMRAALSCVVSASLAAYNNVPLEKLRVLSPLYGVHDYALRLNSPDVAQAPVQLLAEMLQVQWGVKLQSRASCSVRALREVFDAYQTARGYAGFYKRQLDATHVQTAAQILGGMHSAAELGSRVTFVRASGCFTNISVDESFLGAFRGGGAGPR